MSLNIDLSNRQTVVTGATRGIGKAIADLFFEAGSKLILTGTNKEIINELNRIETRENIKWVCADFSKINGADIFLNEIQDIKQIDIFINNAGINIIKPFKEYSRDEYYKLLNINLNAPFFLLQNVIPKMISQNYGRIVNISSIWSNITKVNRSLYSTSKAALVGLTRSLAVENAKHNILVNAISPGFTKTELTASSLSHKEIEKLLIKIPAERLATPKEIANLTLFLCSELNTYLTGQNILIDGGFSIV